MTTNDYGELIREINLRISRVEKSNREHPSSLRSGILMGYQDIIVMIQCHALKKELRQE